MSRLTVALSQAFSLWLMDMHSLPLAYRSTPEFKAAYREYYLRFSQGIRVSLMHGPKAKPLTAAKSVACEYPRAKDKGKRHTKNRRRVRK